MSHSLIRTVPSRQPLPASPTSRISRMRNALLLPLLLLGATPLAHATMFSTFVEHGSSMDAWDGKFPGRLYVTNSRGDGVCFSWAFRDESGKALKGRKDPVLLSGGNKTISLPGAGRDSRQLEVLLFMPHQGHCGWVTNHLSRQSVGRNGSLNGTVTYLAGAPAGSYSIDASRWNGQDYPEIRLTIR